MTHGPFVVMANVTSDMVRRVFSLAEAEEIVPGIFVGSVVDAGCPVFLRERDIRAVINCTKDDGYVVGLDRYMHVPVDDDLSDAEIDAMHAHLRGAVEFIDSCRKSHHNVLVHCYAGRQRSATVVCAYLMWRDGHSVKKAVDIIKNKKKDAFHPLVNFEPALVAFHESLNA